MKRLVYSDTNAIKAYNAYANEVVTACNLMVERFLKSYNIFNQPITEKVAFELVERPINLFDSLLRANAPFKGVAGKDLDIQKLADLVSVDRVGFINACTIVMPGSVNPYAKQGTTGIMQLKPKDKPLLSWDESKKVFILNEAQVAERCELFKVFAESKEQLSIVDHWQNLAEMLNQHKELLKIDTIDSHQIARMLDLDYDNKVFTPRYRKLADQIKAMAVN